MKASELDKSRKKLKEKPKLGKYLKQVISTELRV
jgi:hypothetical protein